MEAFSFFVLPAHVVSNLASCSRKAANHSGKWLALGRESCCRKLANVNTGTCSMLDPIKHSNPCQYGKEVLKTHIHTHTVYLYINHPFSFSLGPWWAVLFLKRASQSLRMLPNLSTATFENEVTNISNHLFVGYLLHIPSLLGLFALLCPHYCRAFFIHPYTILKVQEVPACGFVLNGSSVALHWTRFSMQPVI